MKIWQCFSGLAAQTWFLTSDNRIALQNQGSYSPTPFMQPLLTSTYLGQCLDDTNGSVNDGTVVQIWTCTDNDIYQVWTLS